MSPIDLRGDKAGSSRTASGRRRIRALMPGDTKTPLARDAARRHGRGLVFSPEAADGELSGIWDTSGIPEAAVLPSRAIGAVLAIVVVGGPESRLKWHLTKKKKQKEKESTPAATTKCRAALQKLASFFQYPALGRHTVSTGRYGDSMVRISLFTAAACPAPSNPRSPRDVL